MIATKTKEAKLKIVGGDCILRVFSIYSRLTSNIARQEIALDKPQRWYKLRVTQYDKNIGGWRAEGGGQTLSRRRRAMADGGRRTERSFYFVLVPPRKRLSGGQFLASKMASKSVPKNAPPPKKNASFGEFRACYLLCIRVKLPMCWKQCKYTRGDIYEIKVHHHWCLVTVIVEEDPINTPFSSPWVFM